MADAHEPFTAARAAQLSHACYQRSIESVEHWVQEHVDKFVQLCIEQDLRCTTCLVQFDDERDSHIDRTAVAFSLHDRRKYLVYVPSTCVPAVTTFDREDSYAYPIPMVAAAAHHAPATDTTAPIRWVRLPRSVLAGDATLPNTLLAFRIAWGRDGCRVPQLADDEIEHILEAMPDLNGFGRRPHHPRTLSDLNSGWYAVTPCGTCTLV